MAATGVSESLGDLSARRVSTEWAFVRYEQVRHRLPHASFPAASILAPNLLALTDRFDGFILDAFGVLNVGETAIPGAIERMTQLRALGKQLIVLTNGATQTLNQATAKYRALGFDFDANEVVASREVAAKRLNQIVPNSIWGAIAGAGDDFTDLDVETIDLIEVPDAFDSVDAFIFLSSARWSNQLQRKLNNALAAKPRPLIVANPDLVAPREDGLSLEPGSYAHELADQLGIQVIFHGKPFANALGDAIARMPDIEPSRMAMVGDTLHTDILGGRAAGIGSVLISDHGLFADCDIAQYVERSGIVPDFIVPTT